MLLSPLVLAAHGSQFAFASFEQCSGDLAPVRRAIAANRSVTEMYVADVARLCTASCGLHAHLLPRAFWARSSLFGKDADLEQLYAGVNFSRSISTIIASWGDATYALAPRVSNGTRVRAVLNVRVLCHRRKRRLPKGVKPTPAFEALLKTYAYRSRTLPRAA